MLEHRIKMSRGLQYGLKHTQPFEWIGMHKSQDSDTNLIRKIKASTLDVDAATILRDARHAGLMVTDIADLRQQKRRYAIIKRLMKQYTRQAARNSTASGLASGIGGIGTSLTLKSVDIGNLTIQTYRLAQRLAIINGFDPQDPAHDELITDIFLTSLGLDQDTTDTIKAQLHNQARLNIRNALYHFRAGKLLYNTAKSLGKQYTTRQALRFVPGIGLITGGWMNHRFAHQVAQQMQAAFTRAYFQHWTA